MDFNRNEVAMRWIVIVFLNVLLMGIPAGIAVVYIVHLRDQDKALTERFQVVQAQLDAAIAEQQTCEMTVAQESEAVSLGGRQCLFDCDARECYNRCQDCYKLINDVNRAISIKSRR
jgi:hypothetical protein